MCAALCDWDDTGDYVETRLLVKMMQSEFSYELKRYFRRNQ